MQKGCGNSEVAFADFSAKNQTTLKKTMFGLFVHLSNDVDILRCSSLQESFTVSGKLCCQFQKRCHPEFPTESMDTHNDDQGSANATPRLQMAPGALAVGKTSKRIKQDGFRVFYVGGCGLTYVFVPTLVIPA